MNELARQQCLDRGAQLRRESEHLLISYALWRLIMLVMVISPRPSCTA